MNSLKKIAAKIGLDRYQPNDRQTFLNTCLFAPLLFGALSWWWGADSNWDLLNYHFYNPYAFFHDRLNIDFAPAGMQTFFNPLIDMPYYWMVMYLPAPLVGFLMGVISGLNFVLIAGIAVKALPGLPAEDRYRIPLALAVFGCLTGSFLSTMGNTMGDNLTSLFILGSMLLILHCRERLAASDWRSISMLMLAGFIAGMGAGLKLTNLVYCLAICLSVLVTSAGLVARVRSAFVFGLGVLAGIALTSGFWFYTLWLKFGNPLFPQFGAYFPNPLTRGAAVVDDHWRPKNLLETLFWPFVSSLHPTRVGELPMYQILWPVVYLLLAVWVLRMLIVKLRHASSLRLAPEARFVLAVVVIGYVIWMKVFSIERYLVPLEMCAPLLMFIVLAQLMPYRFARNFAFSLIVVSTCVTLFGGLIVLSHSPWSDKMVSVSVPDIAAPDKATAILIGGDPPFSWIVPHFPAALAFTQVGGSFPETPAYTAAVRAMVLDRGGEVFGVIQGEKQSGRFYSIEKIRRIAASFGVTSSESGCRALQRAQVKWHLHMQVTLADNPGDKNQCSIDMIPSEMKDVAPQNALFRQASDRIAHRYGFAIDADSCRSYSALIGRDDRPYQWCRLTVLPK